MPGDAERTPPGGGAVVVNALSLAKLSAETEHPGFQALGLKLCRSPGAPQPYPFLSAPAAIASRLLPGGYC